MHLRDAIRSLAHLWDAIRSLVHLWDAIRSLAHLWDAIRSLAHLRQFLAEFYALVGNPCSAASSCWNNAQVKA